jgi:curved DNA-binding protein CbpA
MKFCESGLRLRRKRFKKPIANLRKRLHPDLNPGNTEAEEKFKEIASAYGLVGDAENREAFDNREIDAGGAERPRRAITKTTHPRSAIIVMLTIPASRISWIRKTASPSY